MVLVVVIIRVIICVDGPLSVSSSVVSGRRCRREWITVDGWIESNQLWYMDVGVACLIVIYDCVGTYNGIGWHVG